MGSMQIVFLFDLNACNDIPIKSRNELNKRLLNIRLACLRILTDFSYKTSNLRWGFKFFNSCGSVTQKMCKFSFSELSLETFETLESEICLRYERQLSYTQALAESSDVNISNASVNREKSCVAPVKILHLALTQLLSEFQWEYIDMWSPSSKKRKDCALYLKKRNFLLLFSNFKDNDDILFNYFGIHSLFSKSKFSSILLPQTLREQLLNKADVHWVWLNVSSNQTFMQFLANATPYRNRGHVSNELPGMDIACQVTPGLLSSKMLPLLSETLQSFHGSLIPLSLLSQSYYHIKLLSSTEKTLLENKTFLIPNLYGSFPNSLLPFSSIFLQSLYQPFYSSDAHQNNLLYINIIHKELQIPVQFLKILKKKGNFSTEENAHRKEKNQCDIKSPDITWSKFVICGVVSRNVKFTAGDIYLCLPYNAGPETSTTRSLVALNKTLFLKRINLVLTCITDSGLEIPGLLTPLSIEVSILSILDQFIQVIYKSNFEVLDSNSLDINEELENISNEIQNFKAELKTCDDPAMSNSTYKQFQVEALEVWFKPTSAVSSLASFVKTKPLSSSKLVSFHKMLQQSVQTNNIVKTASKEDNPQTSDASQTVPQIKENDEILANLNYDELLSTTNELYNSALESSDDALYFAKKIIKIIANYFKTNGGSSFEENVQNFMTDNLLMTVRRISEKYEILRSEQDKHKKIKECQMQALLNLELETLILPPDKTNCVNSVTLLLRMMQFYSGPEQLKKFLFDILQENYNHNLYDVLVEIGDELGIAIFEERESSDSPDILSSDLVDGEVLSPVVSPNMSERSSSSTFSQKDNNRKLVRRRSDIPHTHRSQQILLPGASPKKKKSKSFGPSKATRFSPRLASRKNKEQVKSENGKSRNVRRNLFPKEKSYRTPKKYKSNQPATPRSKKKRPDVVAETPSHKQALSACQRRKSLLDQLSTEVSPKHVGKSPKGIKGTQEDDVVAETPTFKQNQSTFERKNPCIKQQPIQGPSKERVESSKINAKKQLMQKLNKANVASLKAIKEGSSSMYRSSSFPQYTPESKGRRLSLHLFSKLLSSPTARMGMKKCTKRLFDQVSPQKSCENIKKLKPWKESWQSLNLDRESSSPIKLE